MPSSGNRIRTCKSVGRPARSSGAEQRLPLVDLFRLGVDRSWNAAKDRLERPSAQPRSLRDSRRAAPVNTREHRSRREAQRDHALVAVLTALDSLWPQDRSKSVASGPPVATGALRPGSQSGCERGENPRRARRERATARSSGHKQQGPRLEGSEACVKQICTVFYRAEEVAPRPGLEPGTHGLTGCVQDWPRPRKDARNAKPRKPIAADLQLRRGGAA
jgi:hypothetical protein